MIQNSTHVATLGNKIVTLKLRESPKRMHDPMSFLTNHFTQEHMKTGYSHQKDPDDSIYQGAKEFSEVVTNITTPNEKSFIFQY